MLKMVEAAGVEPASENEVGSETTCLSAFPLPLGSPKRTEFWELSPLALRRRQETRAASPVDLALWLGPRHDASLLCDALPQPAGEATEDGYLIN